MNMLVLALLAQLSAAPVRPTAHAVPAGQRTLADVARERSLRAGNAAGTRPTPIVLEVATPAPAPLPTLQARSLEEPAAAPSSASTPGPTPTTIAVERSSADAIADLGSKVGKAAGLFGLGLAGFGLLFVVGVWILSPLLGLRIGRTKGYPDWLGALAGLLLGPFVLFMTFITPSMKRCPFCLSNIPIEAKVCARCQREQPKKAGT